MNRHAGASTSESLRIAMIGTRGIPARYGGFETAVEQIGSRLVEQGHEVTVFCRSEGGDAPQNHLGMRLVHLPAIRSKTMETLSHTGLSALHSLVHRKYDATFLFNAANAPFLPLLQLRRSPVAVHVDGLEWKRAKWGGMGKRYYRAAEGMAVRWADALIADAGGIGDYYRDEFNTDTTLISYGTDILYDLPEDRLPELGLRADAYHLVVARFEPENHVDVIVEGYLRSKAKLPLIVVGSAPYSKTYTAQIQALADSDARIHLIGGVWDQDQLNQLYMHARSYLHGHSVGGTNPSLLRAMGTGTAVIAYDVVFNREVLGADGRFFATSEEIVHQIEVIEEPGHAVQLGDALRKRAAEHYDWNEVADQYAHLALALAKGETNSGGGQRRTKNSSWS